MKNIVVVGSDQFRLTDIKNQIKVLQSEFDGMKLSSTRADYLEVGIRIGFKSSCF